MSHRKCFLRFAVLFTDHANISLTLKNFCNSKLHLGGWQNHLRLFDEGRISDACEHVRDWIGHHTRLPAGFLKARNRAEVGQFAETDTAQIEVTDEPALSPTAPATADDA